MNRLPDNLFVRYPMSYDIHGLLSFIRNYEQATFDTVNTSEEELHSEWQKAGFDLSTDAWLVVNREQEIVGYARVWHYQYAHIYTQIVVFPIHYVHEVKPFLLAQVEQRAQEWAKMAPAESQSTIRMVVSDNDECMN